MATQLPEKEIVVIGGGLTAGLVARKLVPAGREVLVLERGPDWAGSAVGELPHQRDELRWSTYRGMTRRENVETYTLRHSPNEEALPMRQLLSFLPGFGVGGAAQHWNGQTWRFSESDYVLRKHLTERYGAKSIPDWMTIQDWGISYRDLQPYYEEFEALFGIAGKAGNLKGVKQRGGNPFEPWREREYPLPRWRCRKRPISSNAPPSSSDISHSRCLLQMRAVHIGTRTACNLGSANTAATVSALRAKQTQRPHRPLCSFHL